VCVWIFIACEMLPPDRGSPEVVNVDDEDDDGGPTDERVIANVQLARTKGV